MCKPVSILIPVEGMTTGTIENSASSKRATPLSALKGAYQAATSALTVGQIFLSAKDDLNIIEHRIRHALVSEAPALSEISEYLLELGGKRVRPLLVILSARLFGMREISEKVIDVASGIELIHMATLLHDDIIDQSPTRRRMQSAFHRFGLSPSLLTGDFLLVRAFGICAKLDQFIIEETEKACVQLTEGEILEGILSLETPYSLDDYLNVVGKKTSSLFALAAEVGAHLCAASRQTVERLHRFGFEAGIAFQMIDDILDVVADEDLLGKPVGTDLRQKAPSLVNILWLESGDSLARAYFDASNSNPPTCAEAVEHIRNSQALLDRCRSLAKNYADGAANELLSLTEPDLNLEARRELLGLLEYTVSRCL